MTTQELSAGELIAAVGCFFTMLLVLLGGFGQLHQTVRDVESSLKAEIQAFREANSAERKELHCRVDAIAADAKQAHPLDQRVSRKEGTSGIAIVDPLRKLMSGGDASTKQD